MKMDDIQFLQAVLPAAKGGLGVSSARLLALPAFLASAVGAKDALCNIRPNTTQRRSVEKVPINDWQASVTLILLVFHRLDLAS